jgi:hypothetical protein
VALISYTAQRSLHITPHDDSLMRYTKLVSEEHFTPGLPLGIVLPVAEEDSTSKAVGYLIQELHTSGRWPMLVLNIAHDAKENISLHIKIQKHGSYIMLLWGRCEEWHLNAFGLLQQLSALSGGWFSESWNPRARFVVAVMVNCPHFDSTDISKYILRSLWFYQVTYATVLFLKSDDRGGKDAQQSTTGTAQGTHLELHTWYPYANSQSCDPAEGNVPVKVFTVRNLKDIRGSDIFKAHFFKNLHGCPLRVQVSIAPPLVNLPENVGHNDSKVYKSGWAIELLRVIGKSLNVSLDIEGDQEIKFPSILIGAYSMAEFTDPHFKEYVYTRYFLTQNFAWYTPCSVRYRRWSRFFKIFSVDLWITFAVSMVLAVITVSCISRCRHKSHSHEFKSYSNIVSIAANIIAVSLSVGVDRQPRTASLRVFFLSWVCYSVAISTVFQAYFTTYLIEPGYKEQIKTLDQMLKSDMGFGFCGTYHLLYNGTSDIFDKAILENAVSFPDKDTCFEWAIAQHNFSTVYDSFYMENFRSMLNWMDENKRPLLCQLEDGDVTTHGYALLLTKGHPLLEYINDAIRHIIEGGIFMQINERSLFKKEIQSKFNTYRFDDIYSAISVRHLQTAFYFLLMGYALALASFVTEIMWHRYSSKGHEKMHVSVKGRHTQTAEKLA